jgi:hypothetical protein
MHFQKSNIIPSTSYRHTWQPIANRLIRCNFFTSSQFKNELHPYHRPYNLLTLVFCISIRLPQVLHIVSVWLVLGSNFRRSCWEDSLKWTGWFLHCSGQQWWPLYFLINFQTEWLYSSRSDWAWSGLVKQTVGQFQQKRDVRWYTEAQVTVPLFKLTSASNHLILCRIWGSHSSGYEEFLLLAHIVVEAVECRGMFWRNVSLPCSGWVEADGKQSSSHVGFLLDVCFCPNGISNSFIWNVGWHSIGLHVIMPHVTLSFTLPCSICSLWMDRTFVMKLT